MRSPIALALLAAAPLLIGGCDLVRLRSPAGDDEEARMRRLQTEMDALVRPPTATNARACRALTYGAKACGGPSRALVYSTERTDSTALSALARAYTAAEDALNRRTGRVSTCEYLMPPEPALEGGLCVAKRR